jgi:hypothetical protein
MTAGQQRPCQRVRHPSFARKAGAAVASSSAVARHQQRRSKAEQTKRRHQCYQIGSLRFSLALASACHIAFYFGARTHAALRNTAHCAIAYCHQYPTPVPARGVCNVADVHACRLRRHRRRRRRTHSFTHSLPHSLPEKTCQGGCSCVHAIIIAVAAAAAAIAVAAFVAVCALAGVGQLLESAVAPHARERDAEDGQLLVMQRLRVCACSRVRHCT